METTQRFVALDVHKQYVMVAAINATQHVTLSPRKISMEQFDAWTQAHLLLTDAVVLEATTNAWTLYDLLAPLVAQVKVAHPFLVKLIASARVKTDTRDTLLSFAVAFGRAHPRGVGPARGASASCGC